MPSDQYTQASGPSYRPQRQPAKLDRGTKRLILAACGLGAVLAAVAGGWAVMGGRPAAVPVFEADGRPLRIKPENPGGMQVAGSDEIDGKSVGMAPKPEAPAPQALRAQLQPKPADPAADPAPTPPPAVAAQPAAPQAPRAAAGTAPAATPAAPAPVSAAPVSAALVQLAAVETEQAAQAEWQRLSKRMPELLGSRKPTVQRVDRDGRTIWRVRTGGFTDMAEAAGFCVRVRAKGAACSIASF